MPRHPHPPNDAPDPFTFRCAPDVTNIAPARHALARWLGSTAGITPIAADDLLLICSELVTNATIHGGGTGDVVVRARVEGDAVAIEVEDGGVGFTRPVALPPAPRFAERGRGLLLVDALSDHLTIERTDRATTIVRAVRSGVVRPRGSAAGPDAFSEAGRQPRSPAGAPRR